MVIGMNRKPFMLIASFFIVIFTVYLAAQVALAGMPTDVFEKLRSDAFGRAVNFCDRIFPVPSPEHDACVSAAFLILDAEDLPSLREAVKAFYQEFGPLVGVARHH